MTSAKGTQSNDLEEFQHVLASSKKIIALTGAGLSVASGIPTYRGEGGFWRTFDATKLGDRNAFAENQSLVWQFFHYKRELYAKTKPNPAHYAVARFSVPKFRHLTSPDSKFTHITQNVDGHALTALDEIFLDAPENTPRPDVIEMHGHLYNVECTAHDCDWRQTNHDSPICPALAGTELDMGQGTPQHLVKRKDLPHCPECGQLARPGVVWFGERPYRIHEVLALAEEADLILIIGTSGTVRPASHLGSKVKANGGKIAVFNTEPGIRDSEADFLFYGPCEETLTEALKLNVNWDGK